MDWQIPRWTRPCFSVKRARGEFLREFEPTFKGDQAGHVASAAAHVPAGQTNRRRGAS